MRHALLFPGQGAQFPGMAERWYEESEEVHDLFERAEKQTGLPLRRLCFGTSREEQARTDWTQPCVFIASLAGLITLRAFLRNRATEHAPVAVAGHSLGHFVALVAAGVLDPDTALALVHRRGQIMFTASRRHPGAMASVLGLSQSRIREVVDTCPHGPVTVAAVNGPDQIVLSGEHTALRWTGEQVMTAGAERFVPLSIGIAAHSPLMAEAEAEFAAEIEGVHLSTPALPVALNTTGALTTDVADIRADLREHMTRPVQWWESVRALRAEGADRFVDVGPGRTLGKVLRRDLPDEQILSNDRPNGPKDLLT